MFECLCLLEVRDDGTALGGHALTKSALVSCLSTASVSRSSRSRRARVVNFFADHKDASVSNDNSLFFVSLTSS